MLMKKAINILGVPVTPFSMEEAVSALMNQITRSTTHTQVVTANAEIIMMARNDKRYGTLLQQADLVLADGAGTVWAGRTLGYEVLNRWLVLIYSMETDQNQLRESNSTLEPLLVSQKLQKPKLRCWLPAFPASCAQVGLLGNRYRGNH